MLAGCCCGDAKFKTARPDRVITIDELVDYVSQHTDAVMSPNRLQLCVGRLETGRLAISRRRTSSIFTTCSGGDARELQKTAFLGLAGVVRRAGSVVGHDPVVTPFIATGVADSCTPSDS